MERENTIILVLSRIISLRRLVSSFLYIQITMILLISLLSKGYAAKYNSKMPNDFYLKEFKVNTFHIEGIIFECTLKSKYVVKILSMGPLLETYEKMASFPMLLLYHKKMELFEGFLYEKERALNVSSGQAMSRTKEKKREIKLLQKEKGLQQLNLIKLKGELSERHSLVLLGFFILVIADIIYLLFNHYQLKQKAKKLQMNNRQVILENENMLARQHIEVAELRSNFFINICHEFRTPLTLIQGPLEQLMEKSEDKKKQQYEMIDRNTKRLKELVNQMLEFSEINSGHMPFQPKKLPVGDFVNELARTFLPLAEIQQLNLRVIDKTQNLTIYSDKDKLQKALTNLISNAFKYTPPGGSITITLVNGKFNGEDQRPEFIEIIIKDTGTGIISEHLPFIFKRYYRAHAENGNGSGIGLALTKEMVEMHNGTIEVESKPEIGTTFTISLPTKQITKIEEHDITSTPVIPDNVSNNILFDKILIGSELRQKDNILVVEDNKEVRQYLKDALIQNFEVYVADNGIEAIELTNTHNPDLIVSDIMMPKMDGMELTKYIKNELTTSHIPVILLTAKASENCRLKGLEIGADDYLTKPFSTKELLVRSKNLINQRKKLRELFSKHPFTSLERVTMNKLDKLFMNRANTIVKEHLKDVDFNVEKFCKEIGMNRTSIYLKIKALTGLSTSKYIRTIRLFKAAELIKKENSTMTDISERTGFNSRQAFIKYFKEQFGMTPTQFKNNANYREI